MFDFIYTIPAWVPAAVICGVLALVALVIYILGAAQGRPRRLCHPLEHEKAPGKTEGTDPGGVPESVPGGVVLI